MLEEGEEDGRSGRQDSGSSGPEGELLKAIKMALSGYENALRAERIRRGMRGRVQAGHPLAVAGRVPYGYRYVSADATSTATAGAKRGHYELDPAAAEVVRHIYRWLIDERMTATADRKSVV